MKKSIWKRSIIILFLIVTCMVLPGCESNEKQTVPYEINGTGFTDELVEIRVAVIDTGVSTKAIPKDNISEGKNYVNPKLSTEDTYGHGTAVASIILSEAPDAQIIPLVSNVYEDGKIRQVENATLAEMITDAVDQYDCQIINLSAGLVLDKDSVKNAVDYAAEQDVLVVASAGNDYEENGAVKYYPAAYDSVLSVGSLNRDGSKIATFSQRGDWVNTYVVGEEIPIKTLSGNDSTGDGTSYSAAKVTGRAATILEKNPEISLDKLKKMLCN